MGGWVCGCGCGWAGSVPRMTDCLSRAGGLSPSPPTGTASVTVTATVQPCCRHAPGTWRDSGLSSQTLGVTPMVTCGRRAGHRVIHHYRITSYITRSHSMVRGRGVVRQGGAPMAIGHVGGARRCRSQSTRGWRSAATSPRRAAARVAAWWGQARLQANWRDPARGTNTQLSGRPRAPPDMQTDGTAPRLRESYKNNSPWAPRTGRAPSRRGCTCGGGEQRGGLATCMHHRRADRCVSGARRPSKGPPPPPGHACGCACEA